MDTSLQLKSNKKYIDWINNARENGLEWSKITFGNGDSDEDLQKFLDNQRLLSFWNISKDDWKLLVEKQKDFLQHCKPVIIVDPDDQVDIQIIENGCFDTYIKNLETSGFSEESIDNIVASTIDTLSRLKQSTPQQDPIRGLVMGNVQSGKTANMAALMALAADYGYNMFIVLSGTIENLRVQTEERLYKDLNTGRTSISFHLLKDLSAKHSTDDLSNLNLENGSKNRYITVCLKNSTRLKNLINWINKDARKKKQLKILLIDDEADQAGINTANLDKKLKTRISDLINKLVFAGNNSSSVISPYGCMNYVAYTATPYANFLNVASNDSLYPKNFIATLAVPNEYFGPQQIFGSDEGDYKGLSIINDISKDDLSEIAEMNFNDLPESLEDAICWFVCTVAFFRYYKIKKPVSMLIHTSQKQDDHSAMANALKNFFNKISKDKTYIEEIEKVWNIQTNKFDKKTFRSQYFDYGRDDKDIPDYPSFASIKDEVVSLITQNLKHILLNDDQSIEFTNGIHLCIDNCANNPSAEDDIILRLTYPKSSDITVAPAFIVIGGSTLSRGLTLEGLTTTYFVRNSQQADTLMQMGRWFGYRRNYELLPRLWLSQKTQKQFEFLSQLDEDLRNELKSMQMFGRKPSEYGPRINRLPKVSYLKVTARNKMQRAIEVEGDYNDYKGQTTAMFRDASIIKSNYDAMFDFVNSLGDYDNSKIVNRFYDNSYIWLNVDYNLVFEFIKKLKYPIENSAFSDIDYILDWYKTRYENDELGDWNIVLPGIKNSTAHVDFNKFTLNLMNRTIFDEDDTKIMHFGSINDPKAKKMDIDDRSVIDLDPNDNYKIHRIKAKAFKTPVLAIYVINKDSTVGDTAKAKNGKERIDLHFDNHVVGYDLYIPYGDETKHVSGGKITVKLEFDMSGDIDEE